VRSATLGTRLLTSAKLKTLVGRFCAIVAILISIRVVRVEHSRILRAIPVEGREAEVSSLSKTASLGHRSSSPAIMLIEPNVAMISATMYPSSMVWSPAMLKKHGGRARTR